MLRNKKCEVCGEPFKGEKWKTKCVECYKLEKSLERKEKRVDETRPVIDAIDSRKSMARKNYRKLPLVLPEKK